MGTAGPAYLTQALSIFFYTSPHLYLELGGIELVFKDTPVCHITLVTIKTFSQGDHMVFI